MLHRELGHRDRAEQPGEGFIFMALELQSISFSRRGKVAAMAEAMCVSLQPLAAEAGLLPATCVIRDRGKLKTGQNPEYPD